MKARSKWALIALLGIVAALAISACGSSDDSTSSSGTETETSAEETSGGEGAGASIPAPPTAPEPGIGVSAPLDKTPATGKTIGWLQCELPSCQEYESGLIDAAKELGWKVETFSYKSGEPGPAAQQAINAGVDYMFITGQPPVLYEAQVKAAKAAGIPIIAADDTTPPEPENGVFTDFGDSSMFGQEGEQITQWILNDAGGAGANVAYVTIEDYPILESAFAPIEATLNKYCSDCSAVKLPITVEDLGAGGVPAKIVAFLQTHPEVNYLDFSFADPILNVPQALKSAGLEPKIVGQALGESPLVIEGLQDGTISAWVAQPIDYQMWLMTDAAARLDVGMELTEERQAAAMPTWVIDDPGSIKYLEPQKYWKGPPGFEQEFAALWGV